METYPGQAYWWKYNPRIRATELKWELTHETVSLEGGGEAVLSEADIDAAFKFLGMDASSDKSEENR